jgi:hypothetical protein
MKCLRIFATPDGESHFGEVDIATTLTRSFPNEAPVELSAYYEASRVRFVHLPAGMREAGFHNPPGRLLVIWLDGEVEFETSDGEMRRVSAGKAVLAEDTHGKGHISRHPPEGQMLYWLCCRTALTRLLRSRLLAHRVTSRRRSNSLAFGSKRHSAKQLPPSQVYEYAP